MAWGEIVGFAAGGIGIVNGVPQARRVKALGHGEGVSLASWMLMVAGHSAWFGYGFRFNSPSVMVSNFLTLLVTVGVVLSLSGTGLDTFSRLGAVFAAGTAAATVLPEAVVSVLMVFFTLSRVPQVMRSWRSKREGVPGTAVSMPSLVIATVSLVLWEAYSVMTGRPFLVFTTTLGLSTVLLIAWFETTNKAVAAPVPAD